MIAPGRTQSLHSFIVFEGTVEFNVAETVIDQCREKHRFEASCGKAALLCSEMPECAEQHGTRLDERQKLAR